jgi:hypothetical protein
MATLTAASFLTRSTEQDQQRWAEEAARLAEQAASIAANPPRNGRKVSGDITRLIQTAALLLQRSATIEASLDALDLMNAEAATTETEEK